MTDGVAAFPDSLPDTWSAVPLGNLAKAKGGFGFPVNKQGNRAGPYPFFKVSDMNLVGNEKFMRSCNNWIDEPTLVELRARTFPENSIVFPKIGAALLTNKKRMLVRDSVIDNNVMAVVVNDTGKCSPEFLYQWFLTLDLARIANPGTVPSLTSSRLCQLKVPLPPALEQCRIAAVLGLVQRAVEMQARMLALVAELKQTLLHHLFTHGLRGEPQKQTDLGLIPQSWEVVNLGSLLAEPLRNGHSARASNCDQGIRTLTLTAVTRRDFSIKNTKVTVADPIRVRDMWLKSGDILIERANTFEYVGLAALYEGPNEFAIYPDLMIRVRVDRDRILPKFLAEFLLTSVCRTYFQKQARATAGNFPKIDQGTIANTLVPVPSFNEQNEISSLLSSADRKETNHRCKHAALTSLFRTLLHQLMTAQIRVTDLDIESVLAQANSDSDATVA